MERTVSLRPLLMLAALATASLFSPHRAAAQSFPTEILEARSAAGYLLLRDGGGAPRVRDPEGGEVVLPLSRRAEIADFRADRAGWLVAAADDGGDARTVLVLRGRGAEVETLPSPATAAALVREPRLLADGDDLGAVVWLEGGSVRTLAVRAARFRDGAWEEPATVSPPGRGTQIALAAVTLADGSWLAAWSAFDGVDDEILWSRFAAGAWSAPRPLADDNRVPDVTPDLIASADGALVAWSRYYPGDGYRVLLARFDGEGWSEPSLKGPPGSLYPTFDRGERALPVLTFRDAHPRGWTVVELDAAGTEKRRAAVTAADDRRPTVSEVAADRLVLRWAGGGSTTLPFASPPAPRPPG